MRDRAEVLALVIAAVLAGYAAGYWLGWRDGYAEGLWDGALTDPAVGIACAYYTSVVQWGPEV